MKEKKLIYILNGPNLNLLGEREPEIYGATSLKDIESSLIEIANENDTAISIHQSNHEGELIDLVHEASKKADAIIINPAGYTHTSIALYDALLASEVPIMEVHISNIYKREEFRHKSLISDVVTGIICGLGVNGYILAINAMQELLENGNR